MVSQLCLTLNVFVGSFFGFFFKSQNSSTLPSQREVCRPSSTAAASKWTVRIRLRTHDYGQSRATNANHFLLNENIQEMDDSPPASQQSTKQNVIRFPNGRTCWIFKLRCCPWAICVCTVSLTVSDNERDQCQPNGPVSLMMAPEMIFLVRRWNLQSTLPHQNWL